jgi:hypothetical protein
MFLMAASRPTWRCRLVCGGIMRRLLKGRTSGLEFCKNGSWASFGKETVGKRQRVEGWMRGRVEARRFQRSTLLPVYVPRLPTEQFILGTCRRALAGVLRTLERPPAFSACQVAPPTRRDGEVVRAGRGGRRCRRRRECSRRRVCRSGAVLPPPARRSPHPPGASRRPR